MDDRILKLTKAQLIDALIRNGTVWPDRKGLQSLPKDELQGMLAYHRLGFGRVVERRNLDI